MGVGKIVSGATYKKKIKKTITSFTYMYEIL